jgi:hypothetical protein
VVVFANFAGWSSYPLIAAHSINPGIDANVPPQTSKHLCRKGSTLVAPLFGTA